MGIPTAFQRLSGARISGGLKGLRIFILAPKENLSGTIFRKSLSLYSAGSLARLRGNPFQIAKNPPFF
jgi:hypothetical protein